MRLTDEDIPFLQVDAPQDAQDSQDSQDCQDLNRQTESDNGSSLAVSRELLTLPLKEYVIIVLQFCAELAASEPEEVYRTPLFNFARFCKAYPSVADLPDYEAMQKIEETMRELNIVPVSADPWEFLFPEDQHGNAIDGEFARLDFMSSWLSVRHIPFRDALQKAFGLSEANLLQPAHERGNLYRRFISLAGWLQALRAEHNIYLPSRIIGGLLSCDQRTVSRLRKLAIQDGLLKVVKGFKFRSLGKSEATEFRFAIGRFSELRRDIDTGGEILAIRPTTAESAQ